MAQPNAQNSELDPKKHPSGSRIEKMYSDASAPEKKVELNGEKGMYGENLRPSEREDSYTSSTDRSMPSTNVSNAKDDTHRRTPSNRQS